MPDVNLNKYNNSWYHPGASKTKCLFWYFTNAIFFLNPLNPFSGLKVLLLRLYGGVIGTGVTIKPSVNIKYPWLLSIGSDVWVGEHVWIDNLAPITIGSNVCLSQGCILLTGNHDYGKETFDLMVAPILLEDGCWIGAKAMVCPGVVAGRQSVLTACSVATKNLVANQIYSGNPAISVRNRIIE